DGEKSYQEMHVDGGASTPFFVMPYLLAAINYQSTALKGANAYLLFNSQLIDPIKTTKVNTLSIAGRSFSTALDHLTSSALVTTSTFAENNQMNFRFTTIPADYPFAGTLEFDPKVMRTLFEYGRRCAAAGRVWVTVMDAIGSAGRRPAVSSAETTPCLALPQ